MSLKRHDSNANIVNYSKMSSADKLILVRILRKAKFIRYKCRKKVIHILEIIIINLEIPYLLIFIIIIKIRKFDSKMMKSCNFGAKNSI